MSAPPPPGTRRRSRGAGPSRQPPLDRGGIAAAHYGTAEDVAAAALRQVILVTADKVVDRLGARGKLPVEVLPFAARFCARRIERLNVPGGLRPVLREHDGRPVVSDNGNWILDCALQPQDDPAALERALRAIPGVVDTGLFLGTAALVLAVIGGTVQEWQRSPTGVDGPQQPPRS